MTDRETADQIEDAAIRWVWRLDAEGGAPELAAGLAAWLEGDSRRRGAFLQAQAAWITLDRAKVLAPSEAPPQRVAPSLSRRTVFAGGALAASLAGAAVWLGAAPRYRTRVGEVRRLPLADGSTVAINTQSRISVDLRRDQRILKLDEGEAWFQVAKDPQRPFVVEAGRVRVRAVGTAFSVRRRDGGAEVLVTEGVVETWADQAEGHLVRVSAGSSAFVSDRAAITVQPQAESDVDRRLAWRDGKIDLRGQSLADAVLEFNRYNAVKLEVGDAALGAKPLYGVFRTDDPQGFAGAVAASLNTSVAARADGTIEIGG